MTQETQSKVRPAGKVQIGNVKAAIWKRTNDNGRVRYATTFERTYKTEKGYQSGTDFNPQELLTLMEVARLSLEWIQKNEVESTSEIQTATGGAI